MSAPLGTIEIRPSSELMLAADAIVRALNRVAAAIEAANKIAGPVALSAPDPRAPGAGEGAEHASPVPTEYPRGGGQAAAEMPSTPAKATMAVLAEPVKAPANAPAIIGTDTPVAERSPVSGDSPAQIAALEARMWTPERNAVVRRDYPTGVSIDTILEQLNALPGKVVPRERVAIQAGKLGFNRGGLIRPPPPPAVDLSPLSALGAVTERKPAPIAPAPAPKSQVAAPQPRSRMEALAAVSRAISEKPPTDPGEPVFAGFEHIRRWAGERGLPFATWDDLPAVNSKRERLGMARFKREFAAKGVFG